MRQPFFEDLMTAMYPSGLLHTFGVNGKISGSVGAVGEMQEVLPLLHTLLHFLLQTFFQQKKLLRSINVIMAEQLRLF